ncbi:response regulator [Azospirillum brasilense]|uniref:histidine kinase n=1 Tax=Azospirillum brasilense TaxID=192 RepID=A0A235HBJ9_AZOBR|nr:response regulator [Azospirillum brasilense]OYD82883.1 hybrid sensor histidine kinase/response regulator [Azospirillum brasilense]
MNDDKVNILLVDDQPAKLLSYEVILKDLDERLIKANSAREALAQLLKNDIAVVLVDVCMPELDGFELAAMIREHPRFEKIAIIFISAIHLTDLDRLRGYEAGAVDYIPVPVVPEILRAKVRAFADLHRKTRQLERLNGELERRVAERTAELQASNALLQDSESRVRLAKDAGGIVTWTWDLQSGAVAWSPGLGRLLGVDGADPAMPYGSFLRIVHPDDRARVESEIHAAVAGGSPYETEFRVAWPNGTVRWLAARGSVIHDDTGRPLRMMGVNFDVTDRREATEALSLLNSQLEQRVEERTQQVIQLQKTEALGRLTGGVAHDFNNLLAVILTNLELLRPKLVNDAKALSMIDCAIQGAERGAALTRRMLAFARKQDLKPEPVDVPALVHGMTELLQRSLGPLVHIETRFPAQLDLAHIDPHQLELAILNLAVNGRDAMPEGGTLRICAENEVMGAACAIGLLPGSYVRLSVTDTGTGMDADTRRRAVEPFFTTKGIGKGTGLGLSMVQGLAAQSGGAMQIDSTPGQGTTVSVWLPRVDAAGVPAAVASPIAQPEGLRPCTILLVDDDALVRMASAAMLEQLGHTVVEASSGEEALDALRSGAVVDLVVTDQAMPGMTGVQLIRAMGEMDRVVPALLASGYAELPPEAEQVPRINKPFTQAMLIAAIAAAIDRHPAPTANRA